MKNKIDRTQTGTKMLSTRLSTRTEALVMCCVMLLTAIGSGSVLSAFALNKAADTADNAAAVETIDEAAEELTPADIYDTEETMLGVVREEVSSPAADDMSSDSADESEIVRSAKQDLADTGAKADLANTGWDADGKNKMYIKFPGSSTFSDYTTDSDGVMTFTLPTSGYCEWYFYAYYSNKSRCYRLKGGDTQPNGEIAVNADNATTYYAKLSTSEEKIDNSGGSGGENYYAYLPAGEYTVKYIGSNWDSGKQLDYKFYRKSIRVYGDLDADGAWEGTGQEMTYDGNGNYYYEITGTGKQIKYRFHVNDWYNFRPWGSSKTSVDMSKYGTGNKYGATNNGNNAHADNYFYIDTATTKSYKIWVNSTISDGKANTWMTSEDINTTTYTIAGAYGTSDSDNAGFFRTSWAASETANDLTYNSSTKTYEKTYTVDSSAVGTIYFKVTKDHDWTESWPSSNQTFKINSDSTWVKFSFNPEDHVITVTQDGTGGGSSSSSDWIAGDKYTSSGTVNSNRKVADVPNIGSNSTSYKFVWSNNDTGVGKTTGNTPISTIANSTSGNTGYWADLTDTITANGTSNNFFFALSNNDSNSGIRGNKSEQINCVTMASGTETTIYNSSGKQVCKAQMKYNSNSTGNANFILLYDFKTDNYSHIGVMAYYNNSNVDYQFYFKEAGSSDDTETVEKVNIYAKNGTLRSSTFNRFTDLADTKILGKDSSYTEANVFSYTETTNTGVVTYDTIAKYNAAHTDSKITITHDIAAYGSDYDKIVNVPVGAKIKLQTTLKDTTSFNGEAFKATHYMKAYSFNGKTYQVHGYDESGVYSEEWTVESVNTSKMKTESGNKVIEVTPIYYMKDTTNVKTFYIDGYDGTVQGKWGNMLAVYPYYEGKSNSANAFGGYPGQPMLFWGGKYQMQIPLTVDGTASGASVKGLTLHNAYWDLLHRELDTQCNSSSHCQTYDYDDFYKLNKEKNPDTIIFDFKYETTKDNFDDGYDYTKYNFATTKAAASTYNGSTYNGVELLTDYFGRQVDVFGTLITDSNQSDWDKTGTQDKELLIVSTGYKDTYVGEYATIWAVYAPSTNTKNGESANSFIGYISSSMLYLSSLDRRSQYTGGTNTTSGRMSWSEFTDTYTKLKTYYTGVPALISYEKEIWNDSKDKANRSDGRWYYSNKGDQISADIKIQYGPASNLTASVDAGNWTYDDFTASDDTDKKYIGVGGEHNIGKITLCSAFFTNTSPYLYGKTASGTQFADSSKKFTFEAQVNGAYMFAGWVRYSNGKYYEITSSELGESDMSANDTYIARFVESESGTLNIQHVVEKTATYTGSGTPSVTVSVKNGNTEVFGKTVNDGSKIDISKYINTRYRDYTIDISLSTTPDEDCTLAEIASSVGNFSASTPTLTSGVYNSTVARFTVQNVLDSGATTLRYVSHLTRAAITYIYKITYTYDSRLWGSQNYTVTGSLISTNTEQMTYITGSKTSASLTTDFLTNHTPYEKNFRQKIAWNYSNVSQETSGSDTTYTITASVSSSNTIDDTVRAEFLLPYQYDTKENGYKASPVNVYTEAGKETENTEYVYDDKSYESVPITTQAYKLFTYDGSSVSGGSGTHATYMPLIEAAPYVIKDATVHQSKNVKSRYLNAGVVTENEKNYYYFTYNNVRYFYNELPTAHETTDVALKAENSFTFNGVLYTYALDPSGCTYRDNEDGNAERPAIYYFDTTNAEDGQYRVDHEQYKTDGVVEGTGRKYYFTRWDIYNSKGSYVASTYLRKFNYSGYEDYTIIPIYESETETVTTDTNANSVPTISFLGDGRNQWNNGGNGDYDATWTQGDKLLTDFAISFDYYGEQISEIPAYNKSTEGSKNIRIGMLIEQLGELESVGGTKITDSSYYADQYKSSYNGETITAVQNALATGKNPKKVTNANAVANSKIASNVSGWGKLFSNTNGNLGNGNDDLPPIDNMNRLQWYYTFNNIAKNGVTTTDKDYVYRASAYLIEDTGGEKTVTLSTTPVYFTLYDIASRQLGELS